MAGPKPSKKPKPKPIKHANGLYSFIDCEDSLSVNVEIFQYNTTTENFNDAEDSGVYHLESGQTITVQDGRISDIS